MTRLKVVTASIRPNTISAFNLANGDLGRVVGTNREGHILLKAEGVVVDLNDPSTTWPSSFTAPEVEKLKVGDKVELTMDLSTSDIERIKAFLSFSRKIDAIKFVRDITRWPLLESKQYVDSINS